MIIKESGNDYVNDMIEKYNIKYNLELPFYKKDTGLSIGAMSSQFLAIFYLNDLDHYIKEELNCKYYIRYMDDFLILDNDKEKLKDYYLKITKKVEELKLKVNKKSNIYRSSNGFSFIGYTYKVINNKLYISCKKDTYIKILKKLEFLRNNDIRKYRKSFGSYYGYFETARKVKRENLKVSLRELYISLKKEYKNYIVLVKEKHCYKTFDIDAVIINDIFGFKLFSFGTKFYNNNFDKVIDKFKNLNISFIIVSKSEELLSYSGDESKYLYYHNRFI